MGYTTYLFLLVFLMLANNGALLEQTHYYNNTSEIYSALMPVAQNLTKQFNSSYLSYGDFATDLKNNGINTFIAFTGFSINYGFENPNEPYMLLFWLILILLSLPIIILLVKLLISVWVWATQRKTFNLTTRKIGMDKAGDVLPLRPKP